jgi:hypothetical protein
VGLEAEDALAEVMELRAKQEQPKIWKGEPVTYRDPETGEVRVVTKFRAGSVAARMAELLFKRAGFAAAKTPAEHEGEVVVTLAFDRDLNLDAD